MSLWQLPYRAAHTRTLPNLLTRSLTSTSATWKKSDQMPPRIKIPDEDIYCHYMTGWGKGGQVINKTESAVHLKHIPTGVVVKSQPTRSRTQNYKIAKQILADKVDEHLNGKESRPAIKQEKKRKKQASADKKKRRKYRALESAKDGEGAEAEGVGEESQEIVTDDPSQRP